MILPKVTNLDDRLLLKKWRQLHSILDIWSI